MKITETTLYEIFQEVKFHFKRSKVKGMYIYYKHLRIEEEDEWIMLSVNQLHYPVISIVPVEWNLKEIVKIETDKCQISKINMNNQLPFIWLTFNAIEISKQEI